MKKNLLMVVMASVLAASLLCACGKDKKADTAPETKTEETAETKEETKTEEVTEITETTEAEAEEGDGFSLLDVDENMVDVGAYAITEDKTELVFTMFTGPDQNKYVSLFVFDNDSDKGDVICGQYEASTEVDEDGDEWTYFDVEDAYTGKHFNLGVCERPQTEQVCFFDEDGNVVEGKFLTASETINYMGSAAALISE